MTRLLPLPVPACLLAVALLATGCGAEDPSPTADATRRPAASAPSTPSTDDPGTSSGSPAGSPSAPAPDATSGPRSTSPSAQAPAPAPSGAVEPPASRRVTTGHLLAAAQLRPLADGFVWREVATGPDDGATGACQKTDLVSIGALRATRRTFTGPGAEATQVVAEFADAASARRTHEVLRSWRAACRDRLTAPAHVGRLRTLRRAAADSDAVQVEHYRASYASGSTRRVAGLGLLRAGRTIVVMEVSAERGTFPRSGSPARAALRRIARTFV